MAGQGVEQAVKLLAEHDPDEEPHPPKPRFGDGRRDSTPATRASRALARARRGPPTEADRPPVSVLDDSKPAHVPGQLDIFGNEE
jgi:hypothetical protein